MKIKVMVEKEVEKEVDIAIINVRLPVDHEDEDIPYDFPMRNGNKWESSIDLDSASIIGWPQGISGKLHLKVSDSGVYVLIDADGKVFADRADYVPHGIIPGSFGDYVELYIDETGKITNWPTNPDLSEFFEDE